MDDLNRPQKIKPIEFKDILSPEDLDREIRKFWKACILASLLVPLLAVGVVSLLFFRVTSLSTVGQIAYPVTAVVLMTFGLAFVIPATITSIRRVSMTVRMAYTGLQTNQQTTDSIKAFIEEAKPIIEVIRNQTQDGFLEKIEGHLKTIAERVKRDTETIPTGRRPSKEI